MSADTAVRTGRGVRTAVRSVQAAPYRAAALVAAAVVADQAFDPNSTHVPLCPMHALTGIWCPFCGGLRSAYDLTRLNLGAALHANLVFVLALPFIAALWIDWLFRARSGQGRRPLPRTALVAVLVVLLAFTLVRNLPFGATLRV